MTLAESLDYKPVELSFGTSGLRGLVTDMTDLECYTNTAGFIQFLKENSEDLKVIYIAGDLRDSTPRIMQAVTKAIQDSEIEVVNCGKIPTPALAYYALLHKAPCIMITGSHIPADRNGIKFYKTSGEIMKLDEASIKQNVAKVRSKIYAQNSEESMFDSHGHLKELPDLPSANNEAEQLYFKRYIDTFDNKIFEDKTIVFYQHTAVGRDILVRILEALGANVIAVERLTKFLPIDTENITEEDKQKFKLFSSQHPEAFAIVSTDGDSDRPFVVDETGVFHRGDILGAVVAEYLNAEFAAVPISANDSVDEYCEENEIELVHTKIGSPYVIEAMEQNGKSASVGWEVNGGFLTGGDFTLNSGRLKALPTRDAALPIICVLASAINKDVSISKLFESLPRRYTEGALIDNVSEQKIQLFRQKMDDHEYMTKLANEIFSSTNLGEIKEINTLDGLRLIFNSGDVIHLRPSGNAPQFRVYTNSSSTAKAEELAEKAIEANGYIVQLLNRL